jgi:hypothetical protein
MFYMKIARDFLIWFKSIFAKLKYVERIQKTKKTHASVIV